MISRRPDETRLDVKPKKIRADSSSFDPLCTEGSSSDSLQERCKTNLKNQSKKTDIFAAVEGTYHFIDDGDGLRQAGSLKADGLIGIEQVAEIDGGWVAVKPRAFNFDLELVGGQRLRVE